MTHQNLKCWKLFRATLKAETDSAKKPPEKRNVHEYEHKEELINVQL